MTPNSSTCCTFQWTTQSKNSNFCFEEFSFLFKIFYFGQRIQAGRLNIEQGLQSHVPVGTIGIP
jgi:hypothetical protein